MVVPARSAPRGRKVEDNLIPRIQDAVQGVFIAVNGRHRPIGRHTAIGQLSVRIQSEDEHECGNDVLHVASLSAFLKRHAAHGIFRAPAHEVHPCGQGLDVQHQHMLLERALLDLRNGHSTPCHVKHSNL